jgi:hypothetical protein
MSVVNLVVQNKNSVSDDENSEDEEDPQNIKK